MVADTAVKRGHGAVRVVSDTARDLGIGNGLSRNFDAIV
jgi:hypothetical protein